MASVAGGPCSRAGILHRDLKLGQHLAPRRRPRSAVLMVTDFGLAKAGAASTWRGGITRAAGDRGDGRLYEFEQAAADRGGRGRHHGDGCLRPGIDTLRTAHRTSSVPRLVALETVIKVVDEPPIPPRQLYRRGRGRPGGDLSEVAWRAGAPTQAARYRSGVRWWWRTWSVISCRRGHSLRRLGRRCARRWVRRNRRTALLAAGGADGRGTTWSRGGAADRGARGRGRQARRKGA